MLIHFYYKTLAYGNIKAHQNYDYVEIRALEKSVSCLWPHWNSFF